MRELFDEILDIDDVNGVFVLSENGKILFKRMNAKIGGDPENRDWRFLIESIHDMREIDLVYERGRLYIRKADIGFLVIVMGRAVPIAMVRLNCDIILPAMRAPKTSRGFKRFFKR